MTSIVGNIGTEISVNFVTLDVNDVEVALPIDDQTTLEICVSRPDGTAFTRAAFFTLPSAGTGDGTDGKASIVTIAGDLTVRGSYQVQGHVVKPSGEFRTVAYRFNVEPQIC